MKFFLPLLCFTIFISCTPRVYQYFTVSGTGTTKNEKQELVVENDTVRVVYRFSGRGTPVTISIFNKTNAPLEVNWKRSALIVNGQARSYYSPNLLLNGSIRTDTARGLFISSTTYKSDLNANIYVNEALEFMPPGSFITKTPLNLGLAPANNLLFNKQSRHTYTTPTGYKIKYKQLNFSSTDSPISFRSFLTFTYGAGKQEFSLDHYFYISEIWQTGYHPAVFPRVFLDRGDFIRF